MAKKKLGRPKGSTIKRKCDLITKRFHSAYGQLLEMGMTETQIGTVFGMGNHVGDERRKDDAMIETHRQAMETLEAQLCGHMVAQAIGYDYEEETTTFQLDKPDGRDRASWKATKRVKSKKHQAGNAALFMFLMTNRFKDNWKLSKELITKDQSYEAEPSKRVARQIESLARDVLGQNSGGARGQRKLQDSSSRVSD